MYFGHNNPPRQKWGNKDERPDRELWVSSSSPGSVFKCVTLYKTAAYLGMLTGPFKSHSDRGEMHTVAVLPAGHARELLALALGQGGWSKKAVPAAAVGPLLPSTESSSGFLGQLLGN